MNKYKIRGIGHERSPVVYLLNLMNGDFSEMGVRPLDTGLQGSHVAASFMNGCSGQVLGCRVAPLFNKK